MSIVLTWRDAAGVRTPLTDANGVRILRGVKGLGAAPVLNTIDPYVAFDGAALVSRRRNTNSLVLPMLIRDQSRAQTVVARISSLLQGPGELEYADGVNTRTLRSVIYEGGIDGDHSNTPSDRWRKIVVALTALDPWWYGASAQQTLSISAATAFSAAVAFSAAIPFNGGNSVSVNNVGDGEAYPVITLVGPFTTFDVTLGTTGWSLASALPAGNTIIVDTRPGSRGPRLNSGGIDWSLLTESSRLFTLPKGTSAIVSGATGTTGATSATASWETRYLTP